MSDDLIAFLKARIAEDEEVARGAMWDDGLSATWTASPPRASYEQYTVADYLGDGVVVVTPENADDDGVGHHVARHDPARVLAEVEAKRRFLARYEEITAASTASGTYGDVQEEYDWLLNLMWAPYTDHPEFDEEWKP